VTGGTPKNLANVGPDSVDDYLRVWFRRRKGAESERGRAYISLVGPGRFLHSVSASPDDDLPPGKHIVWGDEAKPPVFGHWPTALPYGPRLAYIWPMPASRRFPPPWVKRERTKLEAKKRRPPKRPSALC
jgi:hypothetical protein